MMHAVQITLARANIARSANVTRSVNDARRAYDARSANDGRRLICILPGIADYSNSQIPQQSMFLHGEWGRCLLLQVLWPP